MWKFYGFLIKLKNNYTIINNLMSSATSISFSETSDEFISF